MCRAASARWTTCHVSRGASNCAGEHWPGPLVRRPGHMVHQMPAARAGAAVPRVDTNRLSRLPRRLPGPCAGGAGLALIVPRGSASRRCRLSSYTWFDSPRAYAAAPSPGILGAPCWRADAAATFTPARWAYCAAYVRAGARVLGDDLVASPGSPGSGPVGGGSRGSRRSVAHQASRRRGPAGGGGHFFCQFVHVQLNRLVAGEGWSRHIFLWRSQGL